MADKTIDMPPLLLRVWQAMCRDTGIRPPLPRLRILRRYELEAPDIIVRFRIIPFRWLLMEVDREWIPVALSAGTYEQDALNMPGKTGDWPLRFMLTEAVFGDGRRAYDEASGFHPLLDSPIRKTRFDA